MMIQNLRRGQRTTSLSTSDEGIVMDYGEEMPRKRRVSSLVLCYFGTDKKMGTERTILSFSSNRVF